MAFDIQLSETRWPDEEEDFSLGDRFIPRFGAVTAKVLRRAGGAFAAGPGAPGQNIAILGFTIKLKTSTGSSTVYRGKPLIFQGKSP